MSLKNLSLLFTLGLLVTTASAQSGFENSPGKAWRVGTAADQDMFQLVVTGVQTGGGNITFSAKISIKEDGNWLCQSEAISGTCKKYGPNLKFQDDFSVPAGDITLAGFYAAGDPFNSSDDYVYLGIATDTGPEDENPCEDEPLATQETDEIPIP